MQELLGTIKLFGGVFTPKNYMTCEGQLLSIAQNQALFSILGTTYGGNGTTNFALPDLRNRVPVGNSFGNSKNGDPVALGEMSGEANHTLTLNEIPPHTHTMMVSAFDAVNNVAIMSDSIGTQTVPSGRGVMQILGYTTEAPKIALNPNTVGNNNGGLPHNNMQPYLGLKYIICTQGIFPSRN